MQSTETLDAVVIGAGWAGLGVSHSLGVAKLRYRLLERARIGETWRSQRWDSFYMNTPNSFTVMPGDKYNGANPEGFLNRNEFIDLLEDFATRRNICVELDTPVSHLALNEEGPTFEITTPRGEFRAKNVVIASGSLNRPRRPAFTANLPNRLLQIDASDYRNPSELPAGGVLVVGSGQSGGQIAEDLILAGRTTFLSTGHIGRLPRRYRGRDIVAWMVDMGLFDTPRREFVDPSGRIEPRPLIGARHTISLQMLSAMGVILLGRFTGFDETTGRLVFAEDLTENLRYGDEVSQRFETLIDEFIEKEGIRAEKEVVEVITPKLPNPPIRSLDLIACGVVTVIWCTGFEGNYDWVNVPGTLDDRGQPRQNNGVGAVPGMYFAGMDFAVTRKSGTIMAVDEESRSLTEHIVARLQA